MHTQQQQGRQAAAESKAPLLIVQRLVAQGLAGGAGPQVQVRAEVPLARLKLRLRARERGIGG